MFLFLMKDMLLNWLVCSLLMLISHFVIVYSFDGVIPVITGIITFLFVALFLPVNVYLSVNRFKKYAKDLILQIKTKDSRKEAILRAGTDVAERFGIPVEVANFLVLSVEKRNSQD